MTSKKRQVKKDKTQGTESSEDKLEKRRQALKKILAGGGTAVTAASIQDNWVKPVIESTVLPAHAQTSGASGSFTASNSTKTGTDLLEVLVPSASAFCVFQLCINVNGSSATVQVLDDGVLSTGAGAMPFNITLQPSGNTITGSYNAVNDQITGDYAGTCLNGSYPPAIRSTATCNLTAGPTGPTGPTGFTGPTGPTGFTGPTGPTGA